MIETIIRILILAAVALLPFGTRWIIAPGNLGEYSTISIYASEVFAISAFLLAVLSKKLPMLHKKSWIIFLLVAVLGFLMYRGHNLGWSIHLTSAMVLVMVLRRFAQSKYLLPMFVMSAAVQSVFGIIQVIVQRVPASKWLGAALQLPETLGASVVMFHGERFLRAYGTLSHPNIFGAYMVVGFLVAMMFAMKASVRNYWWLTASLMCSIGVMISFSRSAWISLAIVLGVLFFKHRDSKVIRQGSVVMILLMSIFIAVFYTTITARVRVDGPLEARSISERVSSTEEAWQLFKRHPLLGVGGGNYTRAVHDELDSTRPSWGYQPVHNVFLLILCEFGVAGFILFSVLIALYRPQFLLGVIAIIPFLLTDHFLWSLWPGLALFALIFSVGKTHGVKDLDA